MKTRTPTITIDGVDYYGLMTHKGRRLELYRISEPSDLRIRGSEYTDLIIRYLDALKHDKTS